MALKTTKQEAQNPLILRCHRIMEAFAKSDDERDFYLDRIEGFLIYVDLDKSEEELKSLEAEFLKNSERYCMIPKLTFYETKKIMEGFVNEKVYDIDTKEKLLDIIQSKEARENFLEFLYDHHAELEKWQQYYQERSRVRIIEWLRQNNFQFVFEEDLDLGKNVIEKLKQHLFDTKAGKDIVNARKALAAKAKTYYSNEALNPRPKRGRPPKQAAKTEVEPQLTEDIYTTVVPAVRPFVFKPDISSSAAITFSSKFESEDKLSNLRRQSYTSEAENTLESLNQKLASLRSLSSRWIAMEAEKEKITNPQPSPQASEMDEEIEEDDILEEELEEDIFQEVKTAPLKTKSFKNESVAEIPKSAKLSPSKKIASPPRKLPLTVNKRKPTTVKKTTTTKPASKKAAPKKAVVKKAAVKKAPAKKAPAKKAPAKKTPAKKTAVKKPAVKKKTAK